MKTSLKLNLIVALAGISALILWILSGSQSQETSTESNPRKVSLPAKAPASAPVEREFNDQEGLNGQQIYEKVMGIWRREVEECRFGKIR